MMCMIVVIIIAIIVIIILSAIGKTPGISIDTIKWDRQIFCLDSQNKMKLNKKKILFKHLYKLCFYLFIFDEINVILQWKFVN